MVREIAEKVQSGKYLRSEELTELVEEIRKGNVSNLEFVSILAAMETRNRIKGMDVREAADFIKALRIPYNPRLEGILCNAGTGGDKVKTINVGTSTMPILAAGGVRVLKSGYKGITSKCGSRDLVRVLGVDPFQSIEKVSESVRKSGIGYYDFANLVIIEDRSGLRSPLHVIAPLCHPLELDYKQIGCSTLAHLELIENILSRVCPNYIITFNPEIDEISPVTPTRIVERRDGKRREWEFIPKGKEFFLRSYDKILSPGSPDEVKGIILDIYNGKRFPQSDFISLNAGASFYLVGKADSIEEGYRISNEILKSGEALKKLNEWRRWSKKNEKGRDL